jgi:hypothetical protein
VSIEAGRESLAPYLVLGILLFAALAAVRPAPLSAYVYLKEAGGQGAGERAERAVGAPAGYTLKLAVAVRFGNGTYLFGERALRWLLERGRVPVLRPTRGDRPDRYDPVGYGVEGDDAVFYFNAPVGEWYWVWPTDCYICTFKIDYAGDAQGAVYHVDKGAWSYPSEW